MKKNVTLSLDKDLLDKSRDYARERRLSFNALVLGLLKNTVETSSKAQMQKILQQLKQFQGDSKGKKWSRDELYERR